MAELRCAYGVAGAGRSTLALQVEVLGREVPAGGFVVADEVQAHDPARRHGAVGAGRAAVRPARTTCHADADRHTGRPG